MPDFRYRQTTATLDVRGFEFRAAGRQPIDLGWRAAFPEWQPADEKGDEAQLLPPLRNGETAQLQDPKIEDKETRPPPRYNEGTLIEAMQNAWRFVDDEVLRERLKEAKGIGTPATRAEIIGGLKKQDFLMAQGKHIVPTETGLSLFGVLKQADPALVDPGVTAQLECLLDDVVVGKQEMVGAIDAVCDVAQRKLKAARDEPGILQMDRDPGGRFPYAAFFWPVLVAASATETASSMAAQLLEFATDADNSRTAQEPEGATPGKMVLELHTVRLRDFTTAERGVPTLLCPPLALHGATVADLAAGHSLVGALRGGGIERLFMADWRSASADMRSLGI